MHRSTSSRAFTLVEILCVVVILGIAAGIIIPQLGTRHDLKAASAARMFVADMMYAQNLAISKQRKHYILFVDQQYTILSRNTDSDPLVAITHPITKDPYVVNVPNTVEDVTIGDLGLGGATIIGFDDLGAPFTYDGSDVTPLAAAGTVQLKSGDITLTVSIEPFTGEASVE